MTRSPLPPFDEAGARQKVRMAEDAWNTRDPDRVALAYTEDSVWRNRSAFIHGRGEIVAFLTQKWEWELDYRLVKNLHAFWGNRIAVRFRYECRDRDRQWWRCFGNENWVFNDAGLMVRREASINDVAIDEVDRLYRWPAPGPRPAGHCDMADDPW